MGVCFFCIMAFESMVSLPGAASQSVSQSLSDLWAFFFFKKETWQLKSMDGGTIVLWSERLPSIRRMIDSILPNFSMYIS